MTIEVKGFNNKELNKAFITTPKIVCDYISAQQRIIDMSEETNAKAIIKIKKLTGDIDDISNSEIKTKKTSNIICPFCGRNR